MVKKGMVPIGGLITSIISIEELKTPAPTVSDKDSVDIGQKLRYLIDQAEAILAQTDIKLSQFRDTLRGTGNRDLTTLESDVEAILAQTDIKLSQFRDALKGAGDRDFTTLETDIESILGRLNVNLDTRASESTLSALNAKVQTQSADLFVKDLSVGTDAVQVDADSAYRDEVIILADSANTDVVYVGNSTNQLFPLAAGASVAIRKTALNLIYVKAASGTQSVHIISGGA